MTLFHIGGHLYRGVPKMYALNTPVPTEYIVLMHVVYGLWLWLCYLTPLLTIFQLCRGEQLN